MRDSSSISSIQKEIEDKEVPVLVLGCSFWGFQRGLCAWLACMLASDLVAERERVCVCVCV
jgi:hypothetical protein